MRGPALASDVVLEIDNITKAFPGIVALSDVSLKVKKGEIHGVCGENGAGKSTLMKILSGVYEYGSYQGHVYMEGEEIKFTGESIKQAIEKGIAIVYQELSLVPKLTVGENIFLGREPQRRGIINWDKLYSDTDKLLKKYKLEIPFGSQVGNLGIGQQQLVEIARAISEKAKVLILDEPTSALTEEEIETLFAILRELKANGVTCIYISHKLEEFFKITDTITVLRDGTVIGSMPTVEATVEQIISMMVGRVMKERFPKGNRNPGETVMEVRNLTAYDPNSPGVKIVDGVSFSIRRGEILGVAGLMGSGRTELVTTLFGEGGVNVSGDIVIKGGKEEIHSAREAMAHKISLVPEDRKALGLILNDSILKNVSLPNLDAFSSFLRINKNQEFKTCQKYANDLHIKAQSINALANSLSGGNQQKVVIAKWLMSGPEILILDEPTRGIDVGAKYEIYKLMNELAEQGVAIVMVSSDLPEILSMSDRILVMHEKKCAGILDQSEATQEIIMALATGIRK
jgi:D-xylose transport system ATP-binding protein